MYPHPSPFGVVVFSPALLQIPSHIPMSVSLQNLAYSPPLHFLPTIVSPPSLVFLLVLVSSSTLSASLCIFCPGRNLCLISRSAGDQKLRELCAGWKAASALQTASRSTYDLGLVRWSGHQSSTLSDFTIHTVPASIWTSFDFRQA